MRYGQHISPIAQKQMVLYSGQPVTAQMSRFGRFGANSTTTGAAAGASTGASIASVVPGVGTAVGAILGGIAGGIAGSINKTDQEVANFDQAVALWQVNPNNVYAIGNKYLPLAGLFDLNLKGPHIPIYIRYNRQAGKGGEEKFTDDFVTQIYQAAQSGKIGPSDTPLTIMANVVQPWIDSWGFGPMQDPHADLINKLMIGMIADYVAGSAPQVWRARGGDLPASFASLPAFSLPGTASPAAVPTLTTPNVATAPPTAVSTPATSTATTPAPTTVLSVDGSNVTAPNTTTGLRDASGNIWQFANPAVSGGSNANGTLILENGNNTGGYANAIGLLNGGQVYAVQPSGQWYQWSGSGWSFLTTPPQQTTVSTGTSTGTTSVPIPAGYTQAGTDATTGAPVYQGLNGLMYEWTGTVMQPMNGTAMLGGNLVTVVSGTPQPINAPASLPSLSAPAFAPTPDQSIISSAPPAAPAPVTAGAGSSGLPSWVTWGAIAAAAYFMFGTARPERHHGQ